MRRIWPLVSLICVTNRPTFAGAMLWMFHAQTWPNKELILIDASPGGDSIAKALDDGFWRSPSPLNDSSVDRFPIAMTYEQAKPGELIPVMRNRGLDLANGEYMTWLDDDGWHDPNRIWTLMDKMEEEELDIIGVQGIYWVNPVTKEGICHYHGTPGFPLSGSAVRHRRCAESHRFQNDRAKGSDHFWLVSIRRDQSLSHGTVNRPELCVGISHGHNISNPKIPGLAKMTGKNFEDFGGVEPWGLSQHCVRIHNAVREMEA